MRIRESKDKVKQSHYRPEQTQWIAGGWGSQILIESAHEGGKFVSPTHRPPYICSYVFLAVVSEPNAFDIGTAIEKFRRYILTGTYLTPFKMIQIFNLFPNPHTLLHRQ